VLLFGIPKTKNEFGSAAYLSDNIIGSAIRKIKNNFPGIKIFTDVCLCAYTDHGHCGILKNGNGATVQNHGKMIDNRKTLEALARISLAHAEAGADYVAPSAMAGGQVGAIRKTLDRNGYKATGIMGYSAKFESSFYGPFRNAAGSAPKFGDRSGYQLDYNDGKWALKKIGDDIKEGADIVMVKPALGYLDIIRQAKGRFKKPLAAYNVSGEYAFVKYGARSGLWDERKMVFEVISSIRRSGADLVITYHAKDIARWLKG
jgi:porphobilinogen synthase